MGVYLIWGEPLSAVTAKITDARQRVARYEHTAKFGVRLYVIVCGTAGEARRVVDRLIEYVFDETIATVQRFFIHFDSEGQ